MANVGEVIDRAMQHLGVAPFGQAFAGPEADVALAVFNELMIAWSDDLDLKSAPVLFDAFNAVSIPTDEITIVGHLFEDGDKVTYDSDRGTDIAGLVSGTVYFIVGSTDDKFKLSNAAGGLAIDLTSRGTGKWHKLTLDEGSAGYAHSPQTRSEIFALGLRHVPGVAGLVADRVAGIRGLDVSAATASAAFAGYALLYADFGRNQRMDAGALPKRRFL